MHLRYNAAYISSMGSIPRYFDGRVVHVKCAENLTWWPTPIRRSWQQCSRELIALDCPGDHASCVTRYQSELLDQVIPELERFDVGT